MYQCTTILLVKSKTLLCCHNSSEAALSAITKFGLVVKNENLDSFKRSQFKNPSNRHTVIFIQKKNCYSILKGNSRIVNEIKSSY